MQCSVLSVHCISSYSHVCRYLCTNVLYVYASERKIFAKNGNEESYSVKQSPFYAFMIAYLFYDFVFRLRSIPLVVPLFYGITEDILFENASCSLEPCNYGVIMFI